MISTPMADANGWADETMAFSEIMPFRGIRWLRLTKENSVRSEKLKMKKFLFEDI